MSDMKKPLTKLTREELEKVLLRDTFIEAGDLETAGWVRNPRNMYTIMGSIQKRNGIKL
tara:strand:+ start:1253 stop:1429 length:177 start_codon:yes stop_codon:yes gene_type:complete